ncbi:MAG: DUF4214 domain-containing protein [Telluria sp.]
MNKKFRSALPILAAAVVASCGGKGEQALAPVATSTASAIRSAEAPPAVAAYFDVLQMIYVGYFGRPADPAGLLFYANNYRSAKAPTGVTGMSDAYYSNAGVKALVDSFGTSAESAALYPGDDRAFVTAIYRNLFNREPDTAGLNFWAGNIASKAMTRANAALAIMGGAQSSDAVGITRKQQVASSFTTALNTDATAAAYSGMAANAVVRTMMGQVSSTTDVAGFAPTVASTIAKLVEMAPKPVLPAAAPLRSGGTVQSLIKDFSGSGFRLLSTAPGNPTWRPSPHAGSVWDDARQTMWVFGSETHGTDMDNAVYGWRASDGQFVKQYDADPAAGYRMDPQGVYWSSAAKNRPWAMHTFRRLRWVDATNEIEAMYDPHEHAGITPIFENPAQTVNNRVTPVWYYNVVTNTWRFDNAGDRSRYVASAQLFPSSYDATHGWFSDDGSWWYKLSPAGAYSYINLNGKTNYQWESFMHVHAGVAYKVGGSEGPILYARHPLNNLEASARFLVADYPALAGYRTINMASVMMPNGKIVIFPTKGDETFAMILDPVANTVTPTGHSFGGMDQPTVYEMTAEWSPAHNAAILLSRRFGNNRVYAYRP